MVIWFIILFIDIVCAKNYMEKTGYLINNFNGTASNSVVNCNQSIDCNFGICNISTFSCECDKGYINSYNSNSSKLVGCNYRQKRQFDFFIMELILGFGSGQFYTNRITHGVLKLLAYITGLISIFLFPFSLKKCAPSKLYAIIISLFYFFLSIGFGFWYIYDLLMIKNNKYKDGKDLPILQLS